jgi:enoyl-CoA hydratase/carnithine racemase
VAQLAELTAAAADLGFLTVEFEEGRGGSPVPWRVLSGWTRARSVTVADIRGSLASSALDVALCCDLVYLRTEALLQLAAPGSEPSAGVLWALGRRGRRALARGLLDATALSASEAVGVGLAEAVVDASRPLPLPEASSVAALTAARDLVRSAATGRAGLGLELATFRLLFSTGDPGEGARAFLEKRRPDFEK